MPQISVIVPIYKVEPYLHRCVDSILGQSYTDFELILVDDGSPDNCGAICDEYAAKDSRIRVIHQLNGGLSAARNAGLNIATGKYICFVDSDDTVKPNLLEVTVPYMEQGADLTVFNHERVYSDEKRQPCCHQISSYQLYGSNRADFYINTLLSYSIGWEAWNRIFRRDIIEKYQLRFADNRRIFAEDMYFSICYCAHVQEIISIPQSLYCYTVREDSIMRQNKAVMNAGRMNELGKEVLLHFQQFADCHDLLAIFPTMHYLIIDNVASKVMYAAKSILEYREWFRKDIPDWEFYTKNVDLLLKKPKYLISRFSGQQIAERLSLVKFFIDGNYTTLRIRNKLILLFPQFFDFYFR